MRFTLVSSSPEPMFQVEFPRSPAGDRKALLREIRAQHSVGLRSARIALIDNPSLALTITRALWGREGAVSRLAAAREEERHQLYLENIEVCDRLGI